ncbi:unnamed protein product [Orchesella dallaii]|uniref:Fatty acid desaturase domain-containing protein n=1 Tax=Orchesella dallaii TaxID=48710 RepID=A0ABP1R324_9HEXA
MCQTNIKSAKIEQVPLNKGKDGEEKVEIVWRNVFLIGYIHVAGIYGLYLSLAGHIYLKTFIFQVLLTYLTTFGVTLGTHRLWAHKCYKASLPLRVLLMVIQTAACQNSIHEWCRDHRVHHKFTETNADPHNAKRGFFFAHVGWLLCKKHDDVKTKGKTVYMADLESDPVVMFQKKYFVPLTTVACFLIPWFVPVIFWGEDVLRSWHVSMMRYIIILNVTWCVNSVAHIWGDKPYDKNINPVENKFVAVMTSGEGWHNYHHTFPWDYKAAELPSYGANMSAVLIDLFAKIGWAYELKTVPEKMIQARVARTGDGSHSKYGISDTIGEKKEQENMEVFHSWGWDDKDMNKEEREVAVILKQGKGDE